MRVKMRRKSVLNVYICKLNIQYLICKYAKLASLARILMSIHRRHRRRRLLRLPVCSLLPLLLLAAVRSGYWCLRSDTSC